MERGMLVAWVVRCVTFCLLIIPGGSSSTFAQGTLSTPEIIRPKWISTQVGFDSGWVGNFQVTIRKTGTATRFKLCLWPDPPQVAYACRTFNQSEGVMQGSDIIRFVVQIPAGQQGRDQQLCTMARTGIGGQGTNQAVLDHMTQDKLILWAVGDGRVPNGQARPLAPPGNIATWQSTVQAWVNAGMPCS